MISLRALPVILFILLALFFLKGLSLNPKNIPSPLINQPIPTFTLPLLSNPHQSFSNKTLKGKPYLLNIWASGCEACQTEHMLLIKLAKEKHIEIYGLSYKDDPKAAKQFLEELGNPYEKVFLDQDGRAALDLGVYGTPETFLIDSKGIIRYRLTEPLTETIWKEKFLPILFAADTSMVNKPYAEEK